MIYKNIFNLTGTEKQQAIVKEALDRIFFPFEELRFPRPPVEIGWRDLNDGSYLKDGLDKEGEKFESIAGKLDKPTEVRHHGGVDHIRNYIFGIMYPSSGRMYIDNYLVNRPEMAKATVSAEVAHNVDYFHPKFTDKVREELMLLWHGGKTDQHTWWEKVDYGGEYYTLGGESFMQAFTIAYSDIPFGDASSFTHQTRLDQAAEIRRIVGIERTDKKPEVKYYLIGKSKIYHTEKHYPLKAKVVVTDLKGLQACKSCIKLLT